MDNRYTSNYNSYTTNRPQTHNSYETSSSAQKYNNQVTGKQQQRPSSSFYGSGGNQSTYLSSQNATTYANSTYSDNLSRNNKNSGPKIDNLNLSNQSKSGTKAQQYTDRSYPSITNKPDNYSQTPGPSTQDQDSRGKQQLSWTKYLSMEFKVEQLQKVKVDHLKQIRQKALKIAELDKNLLINKYNWQKAVKQQERKYQKQLLDQKNNYQQVISTKNRQIQTLLQKVGDQTKAALSEEIKSYLQEILDRNTEISVQLEAQKQQKQTLLKKIDDFQQQQSNQELIEKQNQIIRNLTVQLEQISGRLASRISSSNDYNTFYQVLSSQEAQIRELVSSLQNIQQEYLKLREVATDTENRLRNYKNQHILSTKTEKIQNNNTISALQFRVLQKQHECSSLSRRLRSAQMKIKSIVEQNKTKTQTIRVILLRHINPELLTQLTGLIQQFLSKTNQCSLCQERLRDIKTLQQKISLLKN